MCRLLLVLLLLGIQGEGLKNNLTCYQCDVGRNSDCTDEYLLECPDSQAFDRCMTVIKRTKDEGFRIVKKCALAPCTLSDNMKTGLGMDQCDTSQEEFYCVSCCKQSGCNKSGVASLGPCVVVVLLTTAFLATHRRGS